MKQKRPTITYADPDAVIHIDDSNDLPWHFQDAHATGYPVLFLGFHPTIDKNQQNDELWLVQGRLIKIVYTKPPPEP